MFSAFLSRLRLPGGASTAQSGDEIDDTSSINRSLNLPWPVTESATTRRGPSSIHSAQGVSIAISNPIPRTTPNSLTGFGYDDHAGSVYSGNAGSIRRVPIGTPATPGPGGGGTSTNAGLWYEQEIQKPRSRRLYPPLVPEPSDLEDPTGQTQAQVAPPAVVRLDSGAFAAATADYDDEENDDAHSVS